MSLYLSLVPKYRRNSTRVVFSLKFHAVDLFCGGIPLSSLSEPRWASVNRGVLICDECCSVHRSLGRHSSQVRHLTHTPWPATQLQVKRTAGKSSPTQTLLLSTLRGYAHDYCGSELHCLGPNQEAVFFHFILTLDGSNIVRQRRKFNLGALSPGSRLCDEWQTQSQPSGQTAVSHRRLGMEKRIAFTRR